METPTVKYTDENKAAAWTEFRKLVNMAPAEIDTWLDTAESNSTGQDSGDGESIGHKSGKKIIAIKHKNKEDLTDADYEHMHKVISYISRHLGQKPEQVEGSNWLYSLKNWGHDPTK